MKFISVLLCLTAMGLAGCETLVTEDGRVVANVAGVYDLSALTNSNVCSARFDSAVTITQTQDHFVVQSNTAGFDDLIGGFDGETGASITLSSAGAECTGSYLDGLISSLCVVTVKTCTTDADTGEQTCTDEEFSCQATYTRR